MIVVDPSAWAEFDAASGSAVDHRLGGLITDRAPIAVTEPVVMEVLSRARDAAARVELRRLLLSFGFLPVDPVADFDGAVALHHRCVAQGTPLRGLLDCMTACVAWRNGASLLTHDRQMSAVATLAGVVLDEASPS